MVVPLDNFQQEKSKEKKKQREREVMKQNISMVGIRPTYQQKLMDSPIKSRRNPHGSWSPLQRSTGGWYWIKAKIYQYPKQSSHCFHFVSCCRMQFYKRVKLVAGLYFYYMYIYNFFNTIILVLTQIMGQIVIYAFCQDIFT